MQKASLSHIISPHVPGNIKNTTLPRGLRLPASFADTPGYCCWNMKVLLSSYSISSVRREYPQTISYPKLNVWWSWPGPADPPRMISIPRILLSHINEPPHSPPLIHSKRMNGSQDFSLPIVPLCSSAPSESQQQEDDILSTRQLPAIPTNIA